MTRTVSVAGAGPAGCSAALAALQEGADVRLFEKARTPRHRVCGEFLSPGIVPLLDRLGAWPDCVAAGAAPVRRLKLCFRRVQKSAALPETAYGLSRFTLDGVLLRSARAAGANFMAETADPNALSPPVIVATGRTAPSSTTGRGSRLFGWKAHFSGPHDDAIELYFLPGMYIGVNAIEGGLTNVCGLGSENLLRRFGFDFDEVCASHPALKERLGPLRRTMGWLSVGPVRYRSPAAEQPREQVYPAGDALAFVDPFTGTGIANAVLSGERAGRAAARGVESEKYLRDCASALGSAYTVARLLRRLVRSPAAEAGAALVPARLLFALTRPIV